MQTMVISFYFFWLQHEPTLRNHQIKTDKTTSSSKFPSTICMEKPQTVVSKVIGPAPYQMEPQLYVQGNAHITSTVNGRDSAINNGEANSFSADREREMEANIPKLTECLSTDIVYANQGAAGSFKEQEQGSEVLKSIENLQNERLSIAVPPHCTVDGVTDSPKGSVLNNHSEVLHDSSEETSVQEGHPRLENREEEPWSRQDKESSGTWNKRVRRSLEDSYSARQSPSQQPLKKLKLNNSQFSHSDAKRVSRKGSRAKRKLQSSFSKVQKPVFRPRRRVAETQQKSEIIQNPFVV